MDERKPEPPFHTLGGVIVYDRNGVVAECESRGLAILCSAAPELLAALHECAESLAIARDRLGMCGEGDGKDRKADRPDDIGCLPALMSARAAIAKAEPPAHESSATQRG